MISSIFLDNMSLFGVTKMKNIFHADNGSKSRLFLCSFVIIICKILSKTGHEMLGGNFDKKVMKESYRKKVTKNNTFCQ